MWIHALEFLTRIATHLRCGHLKYTETADIKADCVEALREIQQVYNFKFFFYFNSPPVVDYAAPQKYVQGGQAEQDQGAVGRCGHCIS